MGDKGSFGGRQYAEFQRTVVTWQCPKSKLYTNKKRKYTIAPGGRGPPRLTGHSPNSLRLWSDAHVLCISIVCSENFFSQTAQSASGSILAFGSAPLIVKSTVTDSSYSYSGSSIDSPRLLLAAQPVLLDPANEGLVSGLVGGALHFIVRAHLDYGATLSQRAYLPAQCWGLRQWSGRDGLLTVAAAAQQCQSHGHDHGSHCRQIAPVRPTFQGPARISLPMPDQKCPRCGGPVTILVDDDFDWDCPACQLAVKIYPTGRVSMAAPIRDGKKWFDEPWFIPFCESVTGVKHKSECPREWKERNTKGLEQCPLCGGPVTKEPNYNFGCPACQLLFQMSPEGGRGISAMPNRDRNKPWPDQSWVAKFLG